MAVGSHPAHLKFRYPRKIIEISVKNLDFQLKSPLNILLTLHAENVAARKSVVSKFSEKILGISNNATSLSIIFLILHSIFGTFFIFAIPNSRGIIILGIIEKFLKF